MIRIFTLLAFTFLTLSQGFAQNHVNYQGDSRWFIGLNVGGTWTTQTEVPYRIRGGYGLTFGHSFGMEQDKIFSWDLRARFLHAQVQGQSGLRYNLDSTSNFGLTQYGSAIQTYQDSLGYFIPNYRTNLLRGSMELVLNTNRLRQRTGWNLSVFGGIGITGYNVKADLYDDDFFTNEEIYDYDALGQTSASGVLNFQDGNYETNVVGDDFGWEVDWMPSFGFGISKQVHPYVAIGLEHKMTWTRTNLFDAMPNNFDGVNTPTPSNINDKYHYTALTFKFHLPNGGGNHTEPPVVDEPVEEVPYTDPVVNDPISRKKPIVDIYDPNTSPYTVTENVFRLKANIYYVSDRASVTFKQDGNVNTNFSYNPSTDKFESTVVLHPGQNLFEITGVNEAGSDYESTIIIYKEEEEPRNPPIVTITNPPYTPYETNSSVFGLVSTVLNVDTKSQIRVYFNGVNLNAFSYNNGTKVLNASLNLIEGTNTVTVTATNEVGSDSKTVQILYKRPVVEQPPIVDFINPGVDPYSTTVSNINIRATALNVATKTDLTVLVNGHSISSFSFNVASKEIIFNTSLIEGANIVQITGVNNVGSDSETTTIIYSRPETPKPPIVTFVDPGTDPITVYESSYNVTATVEHVNTKSDITLKINGVTSTLFSYSVSSDIMNFTTTLVEGSNVIEIKGVNEYGFDVETTTIIYKRSIPQAPPIVNITYPAVDNIEFESPEVTLISSVLNVGGKDDIDIIVNGVVTTAFTYNTYTRVLNLPLVLNEGANIVQVTGTNSAGTDSKIRIIKYKKPVVPCPPTVTFVNPPTSPHAADVADFTVTANTTHIDSKSQIVFKQNGVLIPDVAYSYIAGHQIIYNATLIPGNNIFEVSVENADGSDSDLAVINYELDDEPCIIPTVGYISPVPYSTVDVPEVTIDAQINNYSPGTIIELKLNGVSKGYMTYNAETSLASKSVTLLEGSNSVKVIVTNACGTNQATFTLNYIAPDAPCFEPALVASGPVAFTTLETTVSLTAVASHVATKSQLGVKLNGIINPFTYDAGTGTISISTLDLAVGSNTLVISAKTDCGPAILVYTITRDECLVPTVGSLTPASGTSTEAASVVITASIENAIAEDIILLINGVSHAFSFNDETDVLTEALALNVGANTIIVQVANACGTASKTITLTRTVPCESIVTSLVTPAAGTVTATEDKYDIVLHTYGLTTTEQIVVKQNGTIIPHGFDLISGNITVNDINLIDGLNTVVVAMINDCSKASVSYNITYDGCEAPVIIINGIYPGMTVTEGVFNLAVVITNVASADDIEVDLNGESLDFDFNPVTNLLTATFPLLEGGNVIDVRANGCESATASGEVAYEVPCEKISHTLLMPTTSIAVSVDPIYNITLSTDGVKLASEIAVTLNGTSVPFTFNVETEIITISSLALVDGANTVIVSLTNDCSSEVVNYTINYDGCEPPIITLGSNPAEATISTYHFEANVSNISNPADIQVLLNEAPVPFVLDALTGALELDVTLAIGDNIINVIANGCEMASKAFTVNYTEPCLPISYTLGHPTTLTAAVSDPTYDINLVVQHVLPTDITVTLNGSALAFTYTDNVLAVNGITLVDGANTILIALVNGCSSETITYTITHDDCNTPEINLSGNPASTEIATYNFSASVTDIETADQIQVKLNNTATPFVFDPLTGLVTATLTLNEGVNVIQLFANGCESANSKISVSYTIPCSPVSHDLVAPGALITETSDEVISISLNVTNVEMGTLSATLNGETVTATLEGGVISLVDLTMVEGANAIEVTFGNDCSTETVSYTVDYSPCVIPIIIVNGVADGMVFVEQELIFFATVMNVEDAGDIVFRFNGVAVPFEFDASSQLLQAPLTLNEGSNNIEIIVNGCVMVTDDVAPVYEAPCLPPTYTMVAPTETAVTVDGDSYTITLTTGNISEDQVEVEVNGSTVPFTFSSGTVIVTVPYISVPTNTVLVSLTNDCGEVDVSYSVTYVVEEEDCVPEVSATFTADNKSVTASSTLDLMNVILNLDDGSTQIIEDVTGTTGTFAPTGDKAGKCIVGVWIRSGCNLSAAGHPFGDYVANPGWDGVCTKMNPCDNITHNLLAPSRLTATTTVSPYTIVLSTTNVDDVSQIKATVNGVLTKVNFNGTRVTLSGIALKKGANTIQFTLTNDCSTEVVKYVITYNPVVSGGGFSNPSKDSGTKTDGGTDGADVGAVLVKESPVINPVSPITTRATVKSQSLTLKTKVLNVSSKSEIAIYVNGVKFQGFVYSSASQQVSAVINLNTGVNVIKIVANNGNSAELNYYITYQKASMGQTDNGSSGNSGAQVVTTPAPKLSRVSPSSSTVTVSTPTYVLKTRTANVRSKSDLTLTVNGVKISNFTFSSSTKIMTAVLRLNTGTNRVVVNAKNGDKKTSLSYTIIYKKPAQNNNNGSRPSNVSNNGNGNNNNSGKPAQTYKKPVFKYINPTSTRKTVQSQIFTLKTNIANVTSKSNITLTVNGVRITSFTFNSSTGALVASLRLKAGSNSIRITAKNGNQVATASYNITYNAPVKKPSGGNVQSGSGTKSSQGAPINGGSSGSGTQSKGSVRRGG